MDYGLRQKYAKIIFIISLYPVFPVNFRFTKINAAVILMGRKNFQSFQQADFVKSKDKWIVLMP